METRANFVLIGAFTLAAVLGAFLFVMWIVGYGGRGGHMRYQVMFNGSVSGLSDGALVLFNGLKVGEVTHLGFVNGDPSRVAADIDVNLGAGAPINKDTKAQLETQGLTGAAAVALIGGSMNAPPLEGEDGNPPVIIAEPSASLGNLQSKAGALLDLANKLIADNIDSVHATIANAEVFSKALADNAPDVDKALKGVAELGKTIQPLAARLQVLSDDADRLVKAVDTDKVRSIVDNVQTASGKASSVLDRADKLIAENSESLHSTIANAEVFSKALGDNASNVDAALKGLADLSKTIQPVAARIQTLSEDADRLVQSIDVDKVRTVIDNAQTFSQGLAQSTSDYQTLMREGAALATRLNDTSKRLDTALLEVDRLLKAIDSQKVSGIVDSVSDVVATVRQNRDNIDQTLKNFADLSATLKQASVKVDGVLSAAQSFLGSPGTQGAVDRVSDAAVSVKKLADDVDARVREISVGLSRFSNSGLREYEALAIEGRRVLDDIDRAVRSFERNPSQVIFGSKPSLPEYHGGQ
jgi:phospholipid/cholesterol/gamma-HCH transport system substrate-binding protein